MPTVVFATNIQQKNSDTLNQVGAEHRLLSYWYLKDMHPDFLRCYVNKEPLPKLKGDRRARKRVQIVED